jgi:RNA polymerase sigma-70 factor (ECF subfamily)
MASKPGPSPVRAPSRLRIVAPEGPRVEDDATLVGAVRAGQPGAAGRIWDRHAALVHRILRRMLGPVDVEDALQETFLRLFRDVGSLREPAALRSFLIGITLHVAKSELRRRRARRWLRLADDIDERELAQREALATDDPHEPRAAMVRLYQVLDRLTYERRTVFVLRFVEGLELAELSTVLDCSLATTKRRVADAAERVYLLAASDPLLAPYLGDRP